MPLTDQQNIPEKKKVSDPWTFKRLFSFSAVAKSIGKVFLNPFDVLLGLLSLIAGICELMGRSPSWFFWVFILALLGASVFERQKPVIEKKK